MYCYVILSKQNTVQDEFLAEEDLDEFDDSLVVCQILPSKF